MSLPGSSRWRLAGAALLLPLLGGCVAVAALPVLAGGAIVTRGGGDEPERTIVAPPEDELVRSVAAAPIAASPPALVTPRAAAPALEPPAGQATAGARLTGLTRLPGPGEAAPLASAPLVPQAPTGLSPWQAFTAYALSRAEATSGGKGRSSALLESPLATTAPRFRACKAPPPAVLIDLDPQQRPFSALNASLVDPALPTALARLRDAGVEVLWVSQRTAAARDAIAGELKRSGLDPLGRDRILLVASPQDRKQSLRAEAGEDRCIVAIAGDRKSDFDELFDYLRDPAAAAPYEAKLGAGWFLVPPPLGHN